MRAATEKAMAKPIAKTIIKGSPNEKRSNSITFNHIKKLGCISDMPSQIKLEMEVMGVTNAAVIAAAAIKKIGYFNICIILLLR